MSELKKTEITVVQSAEPSLGKVAENENFIKDRKKLMDAILIASTEAENKAYHDKLLDMNPQDYAELSNVKWLFNNNRLRSQREIDDVCVAAKYYPTYKKPTPFGHSIVKNFFLVAVIFLSLVSFVDKDILAPLDKLIRPIETIGRIFMPRLAKGDIQKDFENDFKGYAEYCKQHGAIILSDTHYTNVFTYESYPYHPKGPPITPGTLGWDMVLRLLCLLYLPSLILKAILALVATPFYGFFISMVTGGLLMGLNIFLSAWFAICFGCSVKLSHKVNPAIESLIPDLIQSGVTFEDSAMENVIKPFCSDFWDDVVTMPAESKWEIITNRFVIWLLRIMSLPPIALIIYFIFFYHW